MIIIVQTKRGNSERLMCTQVTVSIKGLRQEGGRERLRKYKMTNTMTLLEFFKMKDSDLIVDTCVYNRIAELLESRRIPMNQNFIDSIKFRIVNF